MNLREKIIKYIRENRRLLDDPVVMKASCDLIIEAFSSCIPEEKENEYGQHHHQHYINNGFNAAIAQLKKNMEEV